MLCLIRTFTLSSLKHFWCFEVSWSRLSQNECQVRLLLSLSYCWLCKISAHGVFENTFAVFVYPCLGDQYETEWSSGHVTSWCDTCLHHVIGCQVVMCKDLTIWALCTHLTGYLYLYIRIRTIIFIQLYICSVAFASILSHKIPHLPTPICQKLFYLPVAEAMERMDENCALLGRVLDLYVVFCSLGRVVSITTGFFSLSGMSESSHEGARYWLKNGY